MNRLIRWPLVLTLAVALVGAVGCGGGSSGGQDNSKQNDTNLIVQQVLPTNGQEVESDLIDVGNLITVRFSAPLAEGTVLDDGNAFNGLTSNLNILDSAFQRVPGNPLINYEEGRGNVLTFKPSGGILPNGQYTVTATRAVKSNSGKALNDGRFDHRSSFTVGTDTYKPVIRNTFPVANQKEVAKDSQIIIIFNESLSAATVTNSSITVVNGGVNPPVTIPGTLALSRDNFEVIFTPDSDTLMPPNATISVTVTGGASGISDVVGNTFEDPVSGASSWQFQFETVTEPPPPNNPLTVQPPNPLATPPVPPSALIGYATNNGIGFIAEEGYLASFPDLSGWAIHETVYTSPPTDNPIANSFRKIGNPGEIIFDPRFGPADGHTWIYVTDSSNSSVAVVGSRDSQVVGRWKSLPDPSGMAIQTNGKTLYVCNFSNDTISAIDLARTTAGAARFDAVAAVLADPGERLDMETGRGPLGAAYSLAGPFVFVANNLENSCTMLNTNTAKLLTTFSIGTAPWDVAATMNYPNVGYFAFITCKGGGADLNGSVSVYWNVPNGLQANVTGFMNPEGCIFDYNASAWVANSGGSTTAQLTLQFSGGGFAATIFPAITQDITTGANPTSVTVEPYFYVVQRSPVQTIITANRGVGRVSFIDAAQPSRAVFFLDLPGVKQIASYLDQ